MTFKNKVKKKRFRTSTHKYTSTVDKRYTNSLSIVYIHTRKQKKTFINWWAREQGEWRGEKKKKRGGVAPLTNVTLCPGHQIEQEAGFTTLKQPLCFDGGRRDGAFSVTQLRSVYRPPGGDSSDRAELEK